MSNEIVLSSLFCAFGGLGALGLLLNRGAQRPFSALTWIAAVVGVLFLLAIPRIYQLPTITTWNTNYTLLMMLLTPMIGGGALAAVLGARRIELAVSIGYAGELLPSSWLHCNLDERRQCADQCTASLV